MRLRQGYHYLMELLYLVTFGLAEILFIMDILKVSLAHAHGHEQREPRAGAVEQRLLRQLFNKNYDTDARGVVDPSDTVTVTIALLLLRIQGLDERSQVLMTHGLIICDWNDERLVWDPADYANITDIVIRPDRIWLPELALMNGAHELAPDFLKIRALIRYDGHVHWEPGSIFSTACDIDIRYFPFDEQKCPVQIGAWAYYSQRMNITNASDIIQTKDFRVNGEWDIFSTQSEGKTITLPCCPDINYPYVEFTVGLRRRYTFYMMNIILPCTLLSILVMVVFCLPPDAGEKISLGISVLLAFTVFLLMVAENIPRTSLHVPVMVIYLTCTMFMGTISVCLTVVVLNVHYRDSERKVPKWIRILCFKYLARLMCVTGRKPKSFADLERRMEIESHEHRVRTSLKTGLRHITNEANLLRPLMNGSANQDKYRDGSTHYNNNMEQDCTFPAMKKINEKKVKYGHNNAYEWKEVAHILDRLFFILVFIFMSLSVMIIVFVPAYKKPFTEAETVDPNAPL